MNVKRRLSGLERLAYHHDVDRDEANDSARMLADFLDHPEAICRWVAISISTETGIAWLKARFATPGEAIREAEKRYSGDAPGEFVPSKIVDLDTGNVSHFQMWTGWRELKYEPEPV